MMMQHRPRSLCRVGGLLSAVVSLFVALPLRAEETDNTARSKISDAQVLVAILQTKCAVCHGKRRQDAGLDVRTRESLLKGGESGPAFVPGKPEESLLLKILEKEKSHFEQSPSRFDFVRLVSGDEMTTLRRWIAQEDAEPRRVLIAKHDGTDSLVSEDDRQYWAFQPPVRHDVPGVQDRHRDRVRNPVDTFLLAKLEEAGLSFAPEADRQTLIRRAYFDLIGLPPEPEEVAAFVGDDSEQSYEEMIDGLLDSPHYGERWGKYWLDAVGYSDSDLQMQAGDRIRPHAWRYRDYVIRSLNADKPYDQFLIEQLAGDELFDYKAAAAAGELTDDQRDKLIATGFLRTAIDVTNEFGYNFPSRRLDVLYDQVQILGSATMGLTLECARCHSHKYDPIPQRDYYSLVSIFSTALDPYDWLSPIRGYEESVSAKWPDEVLRQLPYVTKGEEERVAAFNAPIEEAIGKLESELKKKEAANRLELRNEKLAKLGDDIRTSVKATLAKSEEKRTDAEKALLEKSKVKIERSEIESRFPKFKAAAKDTAEKVKEKKKTLKRAPRIRAVFDMGGERTPTFLYRRGDYRQVGEEVLPGVPAVLSAGVKPYTIEKPGWSTDTSGQRLAFARWLTQKNHPLTSRVMVNRMWMHHFGTGLAPTPGNFGELGASRTHPRLLDWLATEFVRLGWSMKAFHRLLMTSSAYRQTSSVTTAVAGDASNTLYSRFPLRRLDAEAIHDGILRVAQRLDTTPFGEPDEVTVSDEGEVSAKPTSNGYRRAVYIHRLRANPLTMLDTFNGAKMNPNCVERPYSTVATQALQLRNSKFARESADHFALRVIKFAGDDRNRQIDAMYRIALGRPPSDDDLALAREATLDFETFWLDQITRDTVGDERAAEARSEAHRKALASLCHSILNSPDFVYVD